MPELPEVEVVRRGLAQWVRGRTISGVEVVDERSIRRHALGADDLRGNLVGAHVADVVRRGKFLWMPLLEAEAAGVGSGSDGDAGAEPKLALMAHLGMSGQLLVEDSAQPDEKHLKVRLTLSPANDADGSPMPAELRFVDQRIFGGMFLADLVHTFDGQAGGESEIGFPLIPAEASHIARDPLDPAFSFDAFFQRMRSRKTGIKRAILDQALVSGIGNIYADEALWTAKLHFARPTDTLRRWEAGRLIGACQDVMQRALDAGGTSFDSLYVNVNGASGYFERSLNAYGREGEPCRRCSELGLSTKIRRDTFMNRSSYTCPVCQPRPRNGRW
ncbi:MAG: bifunctional DNA-formamidopyrimidine glycosylase/DNA-(apurinic or apyrimidinic site) lyase [Actinomycetota bacterium]